MSEIPPPPPAMPMSSAPASGGKGMAVTSLILGILSLALCLYWFIALPLGIVAVVLGVMARKKGVGAGMALAGIITGAIGIALGLILAVLTFTGGGIAEYCNDNPENPICETQ